MNALMKTLPLAIAAITLVACNAEQDAGSSKAQGMNGQAIDGRIANGLVWVDRNGNGKLDRAIEPFARTDSEGFFSYNPKSSPETAIDYCTLPSTDPSRRHCLSYSTNSANAQLLITGGVDISTGERLKAVMVLGTSMQDARRTSDVKRISPISTLLNAVSSSNDRQAILDALVGTGADENSVLSQDFSEPVPGAEGAQQRRMLANAVTIVALQNLINDVKGSEGSDQDAAQRQKAIAASIAASIASGTDLLGNPSELDTFMNTQLSGVESTKIAAAQNSARAVRTALQSIENAGSGNIQARIRAAEVVFQLARQAAVSDDANARNRINEMNDTTNGTARLNSLIAALEDDENDVDVQTFVSEIVATAMPTDAASLVAAKNKSTLSAVDGGWNDQWRVFRIDQATTDPDDDINITESYFAFYLGGEESGGPIRACFNVVFNEGASNDTDFDLSKDYVYGDWDRISPARLTVDLNWRNFNRDGQMVFLGNQDRNGTQRQVFRLSHEDEDNEKTEETVLLDTGITNQMNADKYVVPTNKAGCEALHTAYFNS